MAKKLDQVLTINLGYRPVLNFYKTGGDINAREPKTQEKASYPFWYKHRAKILGTGFVWDYPRVQAMKPVPTGQKPRADALGGQRWENYYYYLREGLLGGYGDPKFELPKLEHTFQDASFKDGIEDLQMGKDAEMDPKIKGYLDSGKYRLGEPDWKAKKDKFPNAKSEQGESLWTDRSVEIEAGGFWKGYPVGVGTIAQIREGPALLFDTLMKHSEAPVRRIQEYFLNNITKNAIKEMGKEGDIKQYEEAGATFEEMVGTAAGVTKAPVDDPQAAKVGHKIDVTFRKAMNKNLSEEGAGVTFKRADVTSSFYDKNHHHGVGLTGGKKGYLVVGNKDATIANLETHFDTRIDKYNDVLNILKKELKGGDLKRARAALIGKAKSDDFNEHKSLLRKVTAFVGSKLTEEYSKSLMETVKWVLHHMGDAIAGETYANIMPINMGNTNGTLIVIFNINDEGKFDKIGPGGSTLNVIDGGYVDAILNASADTMSAEAQRETLQGVMRSFATAGLAGIHGGQARMNALNRMAVKNYKVEYAIPVEGDIKDAIWNEFSTLMKEIDPSDPQTGRGKIGRQLINKIKTESGRFSTTFRKQVESRLGYKRGAAEDWLAGDFPTPTLDNLWALPFFTVRDKPKGVGFGGAIQPEGKYEGKEWEIYYP